MKDLRKTIIIGNHPIRENLAEQFASLSYKVEFTEMVPENILATDWDDIVILTPHDDTDSIAADYSAINMVDRLSGTLQKTGKRPTLHLLLQSQESLRLLNTREYNDEWHQSFELNAFTMEDTWAKNILCGTQANSKWTGLDHKPVSYHSNRMVHLVILGTSGMTTALAENAALVAHYPNYVRNHSLRTRITVIDNGITNWSETFISRHRALFNNSYYRIIDTAQRKHQLHKPMYEGKREDFVDIEWEFVKASLHDIVVQDKLQYWSADDNQVLSIALCHDSDSDNISQAGLLADLIPGSDIPVYARLKDDVMARIMKESPRMKNVIPFGMPDSGYDVTLPLLRMAKRIKMTYDFCYDNNIAGNMEAGITSPSFLDDNEAYTRWINERKAIKRYSNICNAMTLATKMRSLEHPADCMEKFYAITRAEVEIIAQVEHNRWNTEELLLGYRPCTDEEQTAIENDITLKSEYKNRLVHYDLRAYNDLRADDTGKNVNTYDLCLSASIPLIVYNPKKGGMS